MNARGLAAWCGTDRLSAVGPLAQRAADRPLTPAAAPYALFVAGRTVHRSLVREIDPRLVEADGDHVRAKVAVLPLGDSLLAVIPDGPGPVLHFANSGEKDQKVTVTYGDGKGSVLTVPAEGSANIKVHSGAYSVTGAEGLRGSVSLAGDGLSSTFPLAPPGPLATAIDVYPH